MAKFNKGDIVQWFGHGGASYIGEVAAKNKDMYLISVTDGDDELVSEENLSLVAKGSYDDHELDDDDGSHDEFIDIKGQVIDTRKYEDEIERDEMEFRHNKIQRKMLRDG